MGQRTIKRVSLDFNWLLHEPWKGYRNPYPDPPACARCRGTGLNDATRQLREAFRDWCHDLTDHEVQTLVAENRLCELTHRYVPGEGWRRREDGYIPTADAVNDWSFQQPLGTWDLVDKRILIRARAELLGFFGRCDVCGGSGELPHFNIATGRRYEEWRPDEPPTGPGWQLWEAVSEGSPVSPVFASPVELAEWCAEHATLYGNLRASKARWLRLITGEEDLDAASMLVVSKDKSPDQHGGGTVN